MKRTTIILSACLAGLLPFSFTNGQEKKNDDKIKIIIVDKDGPKAIIDTTFTGDNKPDSIKLKNGSIVYIGKRMPGNDHEWSLVAASSVDENQSDSDPDNVRYVIAKDGLVVTIEGADESKVQTAAKEIEKTLGVSGSKSANNESGKTTVKKK